MNTSTENLAKERLILKIFKGYPSWSGKVTRALIDDYLEVVESVSAQAVAQAIAAFRSGSMDRDNGFPLTAPELAGEARKHQTAIDVAEFWDKTDFIQVDSPEWKALCEAREIRSMPSIEYKGPRAELRGTFGWYAEKSEVARHTPLIAKHRKEAKRIAARGPLRLK
jgi:hypothetical protein